MKKSLLVTSILLLFYSSTLNVSASACTDAGYPCILTDWTCTNGININLSCGSGYRCVTTDESCGPPSTCQASGQTCLYTGSQANCCSGLVCSTNLTCQANFCGSSGTSCNTPMSQSNCCSGYYCSDTHTCQTGSIPNGCCKPVTSATWCNSWGTFSVQNQTLCKNDANCSWTCAVIPVATPIPTRPVPKVFCTPPNGGPTNDAKAGGIWTNLGCVPYETSSFASGVMTWGVGLGGGITLLVLVYAAFLYISSGGDPKKVQAAREMIIALIGGIVLILFAVIFLNYLGVDLLNLGNLGFKG